VATEFITTSVLMIIITPDLSGPPFTDVVLPSLTENITLRSRGLLKGWAIHMENAGPHNSRLSQWCVRAFKAERLSHPASSPNIAPSDFSRFGHIKEKV
jgi:hypothetical protein